MNRSLVVMRLAVVLMCVTGAQASSFQWTGATGSNEWDALIPLSPFPPLSNWSAGGDTSHFPSFNDTVLFNASGGLPISVDLNGTRQVISAALTGALPVTIGGAGTLDLSSGNLTVSASTSSYVIDSGIRLAGSPVWNIIQTGATPALIVGGSISALSGDPGIIKLGNGELRLMSANTYGGTTAIQNGKITLGSAFALQNSSVSTGVDNALDVTTFGVNAVLGALSGTGDLNFGSSTIQVGGNGDSTNYTGDLAGTTGGLTKQGAGTMTLLGNITYNGLTTINGGTLRVGQGGITGSIAGDVSNQSNLVFDRSDQLIYDGAISGAGTVTKQGAGTLILTGTNTYSGDTIITSGTLQVGQGGTAGTIPSANNIDIGFAGELRFNHSGFKDHAGVISGGGDLIVDGGGLNLLGNNTYTGDTVINGAALSVGLDGTTGAIVGDVINNGTLEFRRTDNLTYGGEISGSGILHKVGPGVLTLTGDSPLYTGPTTIAFGGTLRIGDGGTTGELSSSDILIQSGNNLTFDRSGTVTHSGIISGPGTLTKDGPGTLVLTGENTYTGVTTVTDGMLAIGSGASTGSIPPGNSIVLQNPTSVLSFNSSVDLTHSGTISGSGILTIGGSVTLTAANTYTGATYISGSTLLANNTSGSATGSGDVNIQGGGTLGGTGHIDGTVFVVDFSTIAPGAPVGELHLGSDIDFDPHGILRVDIGGYVPGTDHDRLVVAGNASVPSVTIRADLVNGFVPDFGDSFEVLTADGGVSGSVFPDVMSDYVLFDVIQNPDDVVLEVAGFKLPGDFDLDGDVDLDDYNIISSNMYASGLAYKDGDANGDGDVDFEDFVTMALNFGEVLIPETITQTPEPATAALLALGLAGMTRRR